MVEQAPMDELRTLSSGAQEMTEVGLAYVYLPGLKLPCAPGVVDALLCIQQHGGYTTRLFLSQQVPGKGANWSTHQILGRTWYTWSWNNVPSGLRPSQILLAHLDAFR